MQCTLKKCSFALYNMTVPNKALGYPWSDLMVFVRMCFCYKKLKMEDDSPGNTSEMYPI